MKNKKYILITLTLIILGLGYYFYNTTPATDHDGAKISYARDESYIYESDAESADDCTSYEEYDPENKVCYYECQNDAACKDIENAINDEINSWSDDNSDAEYINEGDEKTISSDDPSLVSEYSVNKGEKIQLVKGKSSPQDNEVWESISDLSPDTLSDKYIDVFQVFDNPKDDTLAFVDDEDGNGKWRIAVNLAGYNDSSIKERNLTVVHELGHIITLNNNQLVQDNSICNSYSTDEGCAIEGSYLNSFVAKFWTKDKIAKSKNENNNLYKKEEYVTPYASTNPEEDIAESFAYFVIDSSNDQSSKSSIIKDNKIAFFTAYPPLLEIKKEMLNGLKSNIVRAKKISHN